MLPHIAKSAKHFVCRESLIDTGGWPSPFRVFASIATEIPGYRTNTLSWLVQDRDLCKNLGVLFSLVGWIDSMAPFFPVLRIRDRTRRLFSLVTL